MSAPRPIYEIAGEIRRLWREPHYSARPYLDAMRHLDKITDRFLNDSARSVVTYFLGNAQTWRGDDAKRIKAELKQLLKGDRK